MIDGLRSYPEMKPSGLPWLGDVPAHWDVFPLSRLSRLKSVTNQSDRQLLSVYLNRGVVRFSDVDEKRTNATSEDLSNYQVVDPGDFVLNNQQAWRGSVGVSTYSGIVSPAYLVLSLSSRFLQSYANYLFRDRSMVAQYLICSKGVGTIQRNLYWPHLKAVGVVVPPLNEQRLIVRFLDWHGAQTARLIRAKKKIIALLNEQKQAIIHRAVTRGLDPNAKLKSSGIPWLGDVPEGWEVKRLRNVAELRVSNIDKKSFDDEQKVRLCNYVDVYKNDVIRADIAFMEATASQAEIEKFCLRIGDVIITKDSEDWKDIGVPALVAIEAEDLVCAYHLALLRPIASQTDGAFLFWHLLSPDVRRQFAIAANGVTRYGLSHGSIKELVLAFPDLAEQRAIAAHLDAATANISSSERGIQREIALIQEFRTRLIADVVTGKLDVRAAAASLPDVTAIEPIDDLAEGDDLDEAIDTTENEEVAA